MYVSSLASESEDPSSVLPPGYGVPHPDEEVPNPEDASSLPEDDGEDDPPEDDGEDDPPTTWPHTRHARIC